MSWGSWETPLGTDAETRGRGEDYGTYNSPISASLHLRVSASGAERDRVCPNHESYTAVKNITPGCGQSKFRTRLPLLVRYAQIEPKESYLPLPLSSGQAVYGECESQH